MTDHSNGPAEAYVSAGRSQDLYLGIVILFIGGALLLWLIPTQVNDAGSFGLPPSLAPKALAWVMIACGAVLVLQNLRSRAQAGGLNLRHVLYLVSCVVTVGGMLMLMRFVGDAIDRPNAGFLVAAPLGLIAFTYLHGKAPVWAYAFNAIVAPALIFAAFWWGLELPLP